MRRVVCVLAVLGLLAGCGGGDEGGEDEGAPAAEEGGTARSDDGGDGGETSEARSGEGWTILQYQMADTNLEEPMMADLEEMTEVGTQEGLNIVSLVDRSAEETDVDLLNVPNWSGAKMLTVDPGGFTETEDMGDQNLGDPAVLAEFIATGVAENPAARYALIVSDHGASWPGVGPDDSSGGDVLTLDEISTGIADGLAQAGLDRFDLLGFDACLMAGYEVASTLAPLADRMVASSELEPGHGWDYRALQVLADDPEADADTLGTAIVDGYQAHAEENEQGQEITLSLLDLTQMAPLDEAMTAFSQALAERSADVAPVVGTERAEVLEYGKDPDPAQASNAADLGLLVAEIGADALDVSDQADAVLTAMGDVVAYKVAGPVTETSSGLSIYFPQESAYYDAAYDEVPAASEWAAFLASYYGAGEELASGPTYAGEAETFFDADGLNLAATFDPALETDLVEAKIRYGVVQDDGSVLYLGIEPADLSTDGSGQALGIYDLTRLDISDGIDTFTAFVDLTLDEESGTGTFLVPMTYVAPGSDEAEDVRLSVVVDTEGDAGILSETYYAIDPETGTAGELQADPEGLVYPKLLQVDAEGNETWVDTTDVGLYANLPDITYAFTPLDPGTPLYAELIITDYGGNDAILDAQVAVP